MPTFQEVKLSLRLSINDFDLEVQGLIDAARLDLIQAGVSAEKANLDTDPLINRAIITYCKANFGYDNPEVERFQRSYEMLKQHLALTSDYKEVSTDEIQ
jgi:uncharacterized phage protein (predicted DNA packaging)